MPEPSPYFAHRKNGTPIDNQSALGCELHFGPAERVDVTQLPTWQLRKLAAASVEDVEMLTRSALVTADFGHNTQQALRKWTVKDAAVRLSCKASWCADQLVAKAASLCCRERHLLV